MYLKIIAIAAALAFVPAAATAQQRDNTSPEAHSAQPEQLAALARLVEVWGFVKYHHPDAREGRIAIDRHFFELYPKMRAATSLEQADALLTQWLDTLGPGDPCDPCARDEQTREAALVAPTPDWIAGLSRSSSSNLAQRLEAIYANRSAAADNFQITRTPGVGNPRFPNEPDYSATGRLDEEAMHMLGLARQWNVLRYFFPYRDVMDRAPGAILEESIAAFLTARTDEERALARVRLGVASDDGHVSIREYEAQVTPAGDCMLGSSWRFVEGRLVIDGRVLDEGGALRRGDVVTAIAGKSVADLARHYGSLIAASNTGWRDRVLAGRLARGECGERTLTVERDGRTIQVAAEWTEPPGEYYARTRTNERAGETIQQLGEGVVYVRFSQLGKADVPGLLERANAGRGLVLDMRGYPREFLVFELGKLLVSERTGFATFAVPDPATPGQFVWGGTAAIAPDEDGRRIAVPVVALVDEATISQPEYHAMAWRAAGVRIVGSTTAGADGNVSSLPLPDGSAMSFSGIGVFYPDRSPTQRIGIVPDVAVVPTLAGIAAGRDEQLEAALAQIDLMADAR